MLRLLCPQWVFDNYEAVTPEFLKEHGVKLLLSDLDFTLAPKSQSEPDESLTRWIGALKEAGIDIARRTVAKYREALRIPSSVERKRMLRFG